MGMPHVVWRCLEGKPLPCTITVTGHCSRCGGSAEVTFPLTPMTPKPAALWCNLCPGLEMKILSAIAMAMP
jgi:hypothetical protein